MPVTLDKKAKTALVTIRPHEILNEHLDGADTLKVFLIKRAGLEFSDTHRALYMKWLACSGATRRIGSNIYGGDYYWRITYDWSNDEETQTD